MDNSSLIIQIWQNKKKLREINLLEFEIDYFTDRGGIIGLSVRKGSSGELYMTHSFYFTFKGRKKAVSPKDIYEKAKILKTAQKEISKETL